MPRYPAHKVISSRVMAELNIDTYDLIDPDDFDGCDTCCVQESNEFLYETRHLKKLCERCFDNVEHSYTCEECEETFDLRGIATQCFYCNSRDIIHSTSSTKIQRLIERRQNHVQSK